MKDYVIEHKTRCAVCSTRLPAPIITLKQLPITGVFSKNPPLQKTKGIDQHFCLCRSCGHGQITRCLSPEYLYGQGYSFRTSQSESSKSGSDFFLSFLRSITRNRKFNCILDVGCNDLYLLKKLKNSAKRLIGIDPIWKNRKNGKGSSIESIGQSVENVDFDKLCPESADLIICRHTFEHISQPRKVLQKLSSASGDKTLFVFEFPSLECLLEESRFDRIFHQHLQYFSLRSFLKLLNLTGAHHFDFIFNKKHWGALLIAFQKKSSVQRKQLKFNKPAISSKKIQTEYNSFQRKFVACGERIKSFKNKNIYAYGATFMLPVIYYHLGISPEELSIVFDDDKRKSGLSFANLAVRIYAPDFQKIKESSIAITALDHVQSIKRKISPHNSQQIIMPLN